MAVGAALIGLAHAPAARADTEPDPFEDLFGTARRAYNSPIAANSRPHIAFCSRAAAVMASTTPASSTAAKAVVASCDTALSK
jgi:hypothetical protein